MKFGRVALLEFYGLEKIRKVDFALTVKQIKTGQSGGTDETVILSLFFRAHNDRPLEINRDKKSLKSVNQFKHSKLSVTNIGQRVTEIELPV